MPVVICLLRGVNVGGHNKIKMDALRALFASLKLREAQTYVQSGNIVFRTDEQDLAYLASRIEIAIEKIFGFRPGVILRTTSELRDVVAKNPFAKRRDIEPAKLLVTFLASEPAAEARNNLLQLKTDPEELRLVGREIYIHYPNGMGRPKIPWVTIEKTVKTSGTGRNWNSVMKLLAIAEQR